MSLPVWLFGSFQGELCLGVSVGVSVQGGSLSRDRRSETPPPRTVKSGRYASYWGMHSCLLLLFLGAFSLNAKSDIISNIETDIQDMLHNRSG